ncbi:PREDICTED: homeobox-leucine zipper protein ROC8-like isoform X2 [Nelumbo nucifera]|uniref:Homeobox-leucine zipper protein ROC8-like isoform X2 n=1 Tax=Nelumbo nucifera TaxID=4432 RepID=A0A1U7YY03_NELNU|nr:PREDICTED: homeobox-leucine zipper protein ROC8-like isoform X2 [Nelumbo nucifera]
MEAGVGGGGSGDDRDIPDPHDKRKRYHRHTAQQIQRLEAVFKDCPHPDEKKRLQLSRELGLEPRQIKFWFQNRRTQMKAQLERSDNNALRQDNDRIRSENIAIREALKNVICPTCGGPPGGEYFDEEKLRLENARLREELERITSITARYTGRPISQLPPVPPISVSSLDLSVGSLGGQGMGGHALDLDLLASSSSSDPQLPFQTTAISEMEKAVMADLAASAMAEIIRLLQTDEPLWRKSTNDGRDVINHESYERLFPRACSLRNPDTSIEMSRASGVVIMNGLALVDMFTNLNKWVECFPTVVSRARQIEVLSPGMEGSHSGSLQLIYAELQVLSPLVPTREVYFVRYCQQIEQGMWAVVDVSFDITRENQLVSPLQCRRLPSGCLIQEIPNGYSKVSWLEHVELEDRVPTPRLYRDFVSSGMAYGAERWLATLQRMCERFACQMVSGASSRDLGGVDGRRSMMRLAQRMVNSFCANISASSGRWTTLSGLGDSGVRVIAHKSTEPGQPTGVILSAATSIWVPVPWQNVFNFIRDERNRAQWDLLSHGNSVQEVAHIANGSHPGNCISVLRTLNASQNNMLLLQESCIDSSESLVVYSPVDLPAINIAMSGEDTSYINILPSGFAIYSDGRRDQAAEGASSSSLQGNTSRSSGSLITVAYQILVSSLPTARVTVDTVSTVNNVISNTIHRIKAALNCPRS